MPIGLSLNSWSSIASLQVSQLVIDYLMISENAAKKIILTDSRQCSKERERSKTRRERETFEQTSQRREEQAIRQSALRERERLTKDLNGEKNKH